MTWMWKNLHLEINIFPSTSDIVILKNRKSITSRCFFLLSEVIQRIAYCFQIHSHIALNTDSFKSKILNH